MSDSILDSVALAYQPVWDPLRRLAAVRVGVLAVQPDAVDGAHLMEALGEDWPSAAPLLSLSFGSAALRDQALSATPVENTWIEVPTEAFHSPLALERLSFAVRRGHRLLRQAPLASVRGEDAAPLGVTSLLRPSAEEALAALRNPDASPLLAGQIYEGVASLALATKCLDGAGALGLTGWPIDDVLHAWRDRQLVGARAVIRSCREAIEKDCSLDQLERFLRQDPVLVYRLLLLANSPVTGVAREIETLRHAIMMLGFGALSRWLGEQLPGSDDDADLHPVRFAQVMRARLAQHLLAAGSEEDLRAEVYLTALFSQIDQLMHQPLGPLLHKLPLSERLLDAVLRGSGPYVPLLEVAKAQGDFEQLHMLPAICHTHEITLEHANRSLLRMLGSSRDQTRPPREHPWAMDRA